VLHVHNKTEKNQQNHNTKHTYIRKVICNPLKSQKQMACAITS